MNEINRSLCIELSSTPDTLQSLQQLCYLQQFPAMYKYDVPTLGDELYAFLNTRSIRMTTPITRPYKQPEAGCTYYSKRASVIYIHVALVVPNGL